jgi:hypothetical protein
MKRGALVVALVIVAVLALVFGGAWAYASYVRRKILG